MNRVIRKRWLLVLILVVVLMPVSVAQAQGVIQGDKVILGSSFTLRSGETLRGDLVVMGGSATVEENSRVTGDVAIFGGSATINGTVEGDVAVLGGSLSLGPTAVVKGDAATLAGSLQRAPGAVIEGSSRSDFEFGDGGSIQVPGLPPINIGGDIGMRVGRDSGPRSGFGAFLLVYFLRGVKAVAWAAVFAVLGVLAVMFLPRHMEEVAKTASELPARSFGAGCLTLLVGVPALAFLALTICLAPLSALAGFALVVAWLFGWLALGWWIGRYIVVQLKVEKSTPVIEAILGVVLLTLLWRMPLALPFLGWLIYLVVGIVAGSIGLGAVLLTRFGTQRYQG